MTDNTKNSNKVAYYFLEIKLRWGLKSFQELINKKQMSSGQKTVLLNFNKQKNNMYIIVLFSKSYFRHTLNCKKVSWANKKNTIEQKN